MTCTEYDKIADALHAAMPDDRSLPHLAEDEYDREAYQAVRTVASRLAAQYDQDPAFEYEGWLNHVMNGTPR